MPGVRRLSSTDDLLPCTAGRVRLAFPQDEHDCAKVRAYCATKKNAVTARTNSSVPVITSAMTTTALRKSAIAGVPPRFT